MNIKIVLYVRKGWGNKFLEFGKKRMYGCGNITFSKTIIKNGAEFICAISLELQLLTYETESVCMAEANHWETKEQIVQEYANRYRFVWILGS